MPTPDARRHDHERRYDAAREGVCVLAPDWRFRYVNASLLEILELLGEREGVATLWDALPGWRGSREADALERAMRERAGVCFHVDGERGRGRLWEVEAEPLPTGELRVHVRRAAAPPPAPAPPDTLGAAEHAPAALALLDAETLAVRAANAAFRAWLPAGWREGSPLPESAPGWDGWDAVRRAARAGEPWEGGEVRVGPPGPAGRWLRVSMAPAGPGRMLACGVDVTDLSRGRRAAEAERRALFEILDTLPVGVVVAWAPEGRIAYVNPAAASIVGRERGDLSESSADRYQELLPLRTPAGDLFDPAALPLVRALGGETVREVEMVAGLPDGTERTLLGSAVPLRAPAGEVERAVAVVHDISDRLRLERALMERQAEAETAAADAALRAEESRALREIGRALVSELEPARVLDLATRSAMDLLGARGAYVNAPVEAGQLRVGPALGILAQVEGATFPMAGSVVEWVLREGRTVAFNSPDEVPGSSAVLATLRRMGVRNVILSPLRAFGHSFGILGVADRAEPFGDEDVRVLEALADSAALAIHNARLHAAERHRADESRALLAASEALSSTLDPGEVMARIADIAAELTGAAGAGLTLATAGDAPAVRMAVATGPLAPLQGASGPAAGSLTERVLAGDGPIVLDVTAPGGGSSAEHLARFGVGPMALAPLRVGDEGLGAIAVVNPPGAPPFGAGDLRVLSLLADHASVAVRNARLYEAAQEASRVKSDFLATMSHELRTPLNALEGYAALIADGIYGEVNEGQAHALGRMRASQRHLMHLIEQVLDVARLEAGAKRPHPEETHPGGLVSSVVEALCGAAERKGLTLTLDAHPTARLVTDEGMVRQVLTNLVGNALKFTDRGGVTVRVRDGAAGVTVEVEDTGPGITPEHAHRIWEPFYQVEPTMTRREGGTGLGLPLAREYARLLGGDVTLRSTPGGGSTFTLTLPRAPA